MSGLRPFQIGSFPPHVEVPSCAWAPPPPGFGDPVPVANFPRAEATYDPEVLEYSRPFRITRAGILALGVERYRRLAAPAPAGVKIEPDWVAKSLTRSATVTLGLVARAPSLHRVAGEMSLGFLSGGPEPDLARFLPHGVAVEGEPLWATVTELFAAGFKPEDLDTFAAAEGVAATLRLAALAVVKRRHEAASPRAMTALMASLAGKLKGWSKADLASPFAAQLFGEAVEAAFAMAKPSELWTLLSRLAPQDSAAAENEERK
jgi:hypothetical protein